MNGKSKNLVKALIIAVIVTGILGFVCYYTILKPMTDISEDINENTATGSTPEFVDDVEEQYYQNALVQLIGFLIVVFCITTVLSYIVIERLNKHKK